MVLLAMAILIGIPVVGSVLVTALLVLPGTTAMLLSSRLRSVLAISVLTGLAGAVGGLLVHLQWRVIPRGPAIVLVLCALFAVAYAFAKLRRLP
jgi:ABC-type Mn2+/Zn2+ transport system permease subunit